ncbi:MAG: GNAT family N-acetyltransferase [Anaerolineae bacterium]|nr:GNAT family N-acetyltransferase [Anaerolineae bacterium]
MSDIITDIASEHAIAAHIENFAAFWSTYGCAPGSELTDTPAITSFITGIPFPLFNGVLRAKLTPETVDPAITSVVERFKARRVPAFWWLSPITAPANLADSLAKHHFVFAGNTPGMAADLQSMSWDRPLPSGLSIMLVEDSELLKTYLLTLARGAEVPESIYEMLLKAEAGAVAPPNAELLRYIGFLNGAPVATAAMVLCAGVAGIYAVATLPEARGRGIGSALTLYPLRQAYERGYRIATLQASQMGFPIYHKIGFKTVFNFALYMWTGSRD